MGMSNSEMLDPDALEIEFLARPTLGFQEQDEVEDDECKVLEVASLRIKIPAVSLGDFENIDGEEEEEEDSDRGLKTPTCSDHKIPESLQCPAAPRKPKSRPILSTKRKAESSSSSAQKRIHYHHSNEIEALFPPDLPADIGKMIKKAKQIN